MLRDVPASIKIFALAVLLLAIPVVVSAQTDDTPDPSVPPSSSIYCPNLVSTFQRGARDSTTRGQVSELQRFISDYYDIEPEEIITGFFGRITQGYVQRFQREQGLPTFGIVGSLTRAAIARVCGGTILEPDLAFFNANPASGLAPLTVKFHARVSSAGTYVLNFGDGTTPLSLPLRVGLCSDGVDFGACGLSLDGARHTYQSAGTYTATLSDPGGCSPAGEAQGCLGPPSRILGSITVRVHVGVLPHCPQWVLAECLNGTYVYDQGVDANNCPRPPRCIPRPAVNQPPTINSFSGPTYLAVNENGTWRIEASDPENGTLSYSIDWGDQPVYQRMLDAIAAAPASVSQQTTFTHSYSAARSYIISITVRDSAGKEAKTTTTVQVGDTLGSCSLGNTPVCGKGKNAIGVRECYGEGCGDLTIYEQKTYANRCLMNADSATFVSEGICPGPTPPVACTQEARICPNGSAVGRTGPNCEFAACPTPTTVCPEVQRPQGTTCTLADSDVESGVWQAYTTAQGCPNWRCVQSATDFPPASASANNAQLAAILAGFESALRTLLSWLGN